LDGSHYICWPKLEMENSRMLTFSVL
jgi:hypothetical protein